MNENITTINLSRIDDHMNFEAVNKNGKSILMDGSKAVGGKDNGVGPMETLLMAAAGCSTIDIVLILKKMNQELLDIKVKVDGEVIKVGDAKEYKTIHLHFDVWGPLKESKVDKAINMSLEKYCSVSKILQKSAEITSSFKLH